jgi:hypothetical protein
MIPRRASFAVSGTPVNRSNTVRDLDKTLKCALFCCGTVVFIDQDILTHSPMFFASSPSEKSPARPFMRLTAPFLCYVPLPYLPVLFIPSPPLFILQVYWSLVFTTTLDAPAPTLFPA